MIKNSVTFLAVLILLTLSGCPELINTPFSYDPDPIDPSVTLPDPAEDLYIIANVDGTIYGIDSSDPLSYRALATDANIEENFSEIRISPDKTYILYANVSKDLVLLNISDPETPVLAAVIDTNIESNESEFIDNTRVFYTSHGSIRVYEIAIPSVAQYTLIQQQPNRCNHVAQLSPDKDKIVYKDQWTTTNLGGFHYWSPVVLGVESTEGTVIFPYGSSMDLYEPFYYCWRDNDRVIFKYEPGGTSALYENNVTSGVSTNALLRQSGVDILFEKLKIFPNTNDPTRMNLLIYGGNSLFMLDLPTDTAINGIIEVSEIYSSLYKTKYAAFGSNSESFVVGTNNWMGIYNTVGLGKTNVSIENVFGDFGTLYALHCR